MMRVASLTRAPSSPQHDQWPMGECDSADAADDLLDAAHSVVYDLGGDESGEDCPTQKGG